jgi:tetratricopeptide (TPR) repeat protein
MADFKTLALRIYILLLLSLLCSDTYAQPNCLLFPEESPCRKACKITEIASELSQGSKYSQELFDIAISLCPNMAFAWVEKSVPYLKRGDFATWRRLLDKAVELDPAQYLGYRAGCLFDFLRDYKNALKDLERLEEITGSPLVGHTANGDYDLNIVKAICLRELGLINNSLLTFESCIINKEKNDLVGLYDYYHYGVTLYNLKRYNESLIQFEKQVRRYESFAETYYFLGLVNEEKGDRTSAVKYFETSLEKYTKSGYHRKDPYCIMPDQIFLADIQKKLNAFRKQND